VNRRISRVPALHVSQLFVAGDLPGAPDDVLRAADVPERRDMTISEAAALTWLLCGPTEKPLGVAGYRDVYDYQTSSDVREVTHLAGSARAVVDLVRFLIADAKMRRCTGRMDAGNERMIRLLGRLGCISKRVFWESA
jgi:RimJ/RimL family protein N-acetyltransferase